MKESLDCSLLYFAGLYNFVNDEEGYERSAKFAARLVGIGGHFIPARQGAAVLTAEVDVLSHFDRTRLDPWIGRTVLPPSVVQSEVQRYVDEGDFDPDWGRQLRAWLQVLRTYPQLWICVDVPGEVQSSATVISYWTYPPSFIDGTEAADAEAWAPDDAARILVDDIYVAIDNLFSAMVFDIGEFAYPAEELRKLAFIYGMSIPDPVRVWSTDHVRFKPLLSRTLLAPLKESVTATRVGQTYTLLNASGFVGMTGDRKAHV